MKKRSCPNHEYKYDLEEIFPYEIQAEGAKERVWSNIRRRRPMMHVFLRAAALLLILILVSGNLWLLYERDRLAGTLSEIMESSNQTEDSQKSEGMGVIEHIAFDHKPEPEIRHHYIDRLVTVRVTDTVYKTDTIHIFRESVEQRFAQAKPDTVFIERFTANTPIGTFGSTPHTIVVIDDQKPAYEQRKRISFSLLSFQ